MAIAPFDIRRYLANVTNRTTFRIDPVVSYCYCVPTKGKINMTIKHNQSGFAHPVAIGVVVLALGVIGFAGYTVITGNNDKKVNSAEQQTAVADALPLNMDGVLEVSKVTELATDSSTATVSDLELENENGQLVYKVLLSDGSLVVLNAKTGAKVPGSHTKPETGDDKVILPPSFTVKLSFTKAREIAQAKFPNSTVTKIKLNSEGGKVTISVRFADNARVDVDANTGDIVRVKDPKQTKPAQNSTGTSSTSSSSRSSDSSSSSTSRDGGNDDSSDNSSSGSGSSSSDDDNDTNDSNNDSGSNSGSGSDDRR
jgi:uncharacterized membrane protein YkoI